MISGIVDLAKMKIVYHALRRFLCWPLALEMTKSDLGVQISNIQLTAQKRDSSNQCVKIFWRSHGTPIISKRAAIMQDCTGFEKIYSNYIPIYIFDIKWKAECTPWRCLQIQSSQMHSSDIFWDLIQRKGGHEFSEKKTRTTHSKTTLCKSTKLKKEVDEDSHNMALTAIGHSCLFVHSISASTYPVGGVGPTIFTMIRKILHFYINTPATRNYYHATICSENSFSNSKNNAAKIRC